MNCKNCEEQLNENATYCLNCGARVIKNRLTIKNLFGHALEQYFNVDNRFLMTFLHLLIKPHIVIDSYIQGMRKRYVNPLSYIAIALTLSGVIVFLLKKFNTMDLIFDVIPQQAGQQLFQQKVNEFTLEYSSLLFIFYIPALAIPSLIIFLDKRYNLTEHLVAYVYIFAQYSLFTFPFSLLIILFAPKWYIWFGLVVLIFIPFYSMIIFKKIFKISLSNLIPRFLGFCFLGLIAYFAISLIPIIFLFATGEISIQDLVPKVPK
ncbi:DUF3667 domain-containing protein [Spongiivirga citrea]|uniref:DUF3667 domain-containing protein n=1 Tax=Spongiivirga citrea TaxID=1481457 RepID=A0A6M0CPU4_9FLAO|nr:DUF3667 domain-containing protein [Spongiivirga citrea]NER17889.1 DUF3667 domain-containing protein [Spongiivirga citrea]